MSGGIPTSAFGGLRRRARIGIAFDGLAAAMVVLAAFTVLSYAADRTLRLEVGYRAALLVVVAVALVQAVRRRALRPLRVALTDDELALAVERQDRSLHEALISAVQFERTLADPHGSGPESPDLMRLVVDDVARRSRDIRFVQALSGRRFARRVAMVAAVAAAGSAWLALDAGTVRLWLARNVLLSSEQWPRSTHLRFVEQVTRVPRGDDVTVRVQADGVVPDAVELRYRTAGGDSGRERMTLTGEREFRFTIETLLEDITLHARGGDGLSDEVTITVVPRPALLELAVVLEPPAYTGLPPTELREQADLRVLRGTRVRLSAVSTKPLREAWMQVGEGDRLPLAVAADGRGVSGELVAETSAALTVDVLDADRLGTAAPLRVHLRVTEDAPPTVTLTPVGVGPMVTPFARLVLEAEVADDYGIAALAALHQVSGRSQATVDNGAQSPADEAPPEFTPIELAGLTPLTEPVPEWMATLSLDLRLLNPVEDEFAAGNKLQPGQVLALRIDATDVRAPEPLVGSNEPVALRIVTRQEMADDLRRRQLEQRRMLEGVLVQQVGVRDGLAAVAAPGAEPHPPRALQAVRTAARNERDLSGRCLSIAEAYRQILDEFVNNRLAEDADVRPLRELVVAALVRIAEQDLPRAAAAAEAFAQDGQEDVKAAAVATCDSVVTAIRAVLGHMQEEERLAQLLARLREVIRLQDAAAEEARRRRDAAGAEVFGPGGERRRDK